MKPALTRSRRKLQQQQRAGKKRPKQQMSREKLQIREALLEAETHQHYQNHKKQHEPQPRAAHPQTQCEHQEQQHPLRLKIFLAKWNKAWRRQKEEK